MGAFSPIWSDIDKTRPGQPYLCDSDGWGWLFLFLLLALPFLYLAALIAEFSAFFAEHLMLCLVIYTVFSVLAGTLLYRNRAYQKRVLGIVAVVITMLPALLLTAFYAVPLIRLDPGFDATFDFIILLFLAIGGEFLVFSLSKLVKNGKTHLLMALGLLALSLLLLCACIAGEKTLLTPGAIRSVYQGT